MKLSGPEGANPSKQRRMLEKTLRNIDIVAGLLFCGMGLAVFFRQSLVLGFMEQVIGLPVLHVVIGLGYLASGGWLLYHGIRRIPMSTVQFTLAGMVLFVHTTLTVYFNIINQSWIATFIFALVMVHHYSIALLRGPLRTYVR